MANTTTSATDSITLTVIPDGLPDDITQSVLVFTGIDPETGENFHFGVDHGPARAIIEALTSGGEDEVEVVLDGWQIIGKGAF